jgi:hypothetical protein
LLHPIAHTRDTHSRQKLTFSRFSISPSTSFKHFQSSSSQSIPLCKKKSINSRKFICVLNSLFSILCKRFVLSFLTITPDLAGHKSCVEITDYKNARPILLTSGTKLIIIVKNVNTIFFSFLLSANSVCFRAELCMDWKILFRESRVVW